MNNLKHSTALWLLVLVILILGLGWPINKIGLAYTSPTNYMELRFLIGTLATFLVAWMGKQLKVPKRNDLPIILTVGLFQMALMMNFANYGLSYVGAGEATFLAFTVSVWIIPLSAVINRRFSPLEGLSFLIGLLGVAYLIQLRTFEEGTAWIGCLMLLLSAISWAIGLLCAHHMKWHRPFVQLLPWQLLLATLFTMGVAYFQDIPLLPQSTDPIFIGSLLYTGGLSIAIRYWLSILIGKHLPPATISLGLLFVPILSFGVSTLFLQEQLSPSSFGGIVLLTTASLIHIYSERRDARNLSY